MSSLFEQVRYGNFTKGRKRGQRRSALVTLRKDDLLFFGISKCHKTKDRWDRDQAKHRARIRAQEALNMFRDEKEENCTPNWQDRGGVVVHEDGTLGYCNISNVSNLLNYFSVVTQYLPKSPQEYADRERRRSERAQRRAEQQAAMERRQVERARREAEKELPVTLMETPEEEVHI